MEARDQLLVDDVLRPVFRARFVLYWVGVAIAVVLVALGAPPVLLPAVTLGAVAAWWQRRSQAIVSSWLLDTALALVIAHVQESPLGVAMIVSWGGLLGLTRVRRRWLIACVNAIAAGGATALMEPGSVVFSVEAVVRWAASMIVVLFVFVMFRNVSDLVRRSERELRAFFERVPIALTRTTTDGRLLEFNRATTAMFDNPTVGENVVDRYADPAARQEFIDLLERDGAVRHHEASVMTSPGETIEAIVSANAVTDADGELRYIETAVLDATPLRKLERERELLARVIDSASDLVAVGDWDGSIRYANSAAKDWTRRHISSDDEIHALQVFAADDVAMVMKALRDQGDWTGVLNVTGLDHQRILSATFQVVGIAGETTIAAVGRDVTDEIATQRQLEELVRAKDELVASISHEIRTPLSVVLGLASELRDNHGNFDDETHTEFAGLIAEQGQEMAHIVEDLLVAARADTGSIILDLTEVDLRHETEMTLRSISRSDQPDHIENDVAGTCWGDPTRIRQILRNLIVNAHRHGGDRVKLASHAAGGRVSIEVTDNGSGVAEESIDSIFEPFARAPGQPSEPASIGLGLSVSRDLANRMGGDLVYSRHNGETVFTLTLPGSGRQLDEPR